MQSKVKATGGLKRLKGSGFKMLRQIIAKKKKTPNHKLFKITTISLHLEEGLISETLVSLNTLLSFYQNFKD